MINLGVDNKSAMAARLAISQISRAAGMGGGALGGFGKALGIVGLIAAAAAPALGLVGTAILGLPGLMAAVGAPIAAIALGFDGIKRAAEVAKPALDSLKESLSATFEAGMTPVFQQIANVLLPGITTGMNGVANGVIAIAQGFTNVVTSGNGMDAIREILANIGTFLTSIVPMVESLTQGFLTLTAVGTQALTQFAPILNQFGAQFNEMVTRLADSGVLRDAFAGLGLVMGSVLTLFLQLLEIGANSMAVLGGPLAAAITQIGNTLVVIMPSLTQFSALFLNLATTILAALTPALPPLMAGINALVVAFTPLIVDLAHLAAFVLPVVAQLLQWLAPVLPVIAVGVLAMVAAFKAYRMIVAMVTIAQIAWNVAMMANPIGLIILGIIGLVAVVVYCWTHFQWFRDIVTAVWQGIVTVAMWAWNNILLPAFNGIMAAVMAVGGFFVWLWQGVMVPAWNGIVAVVMWAWNNIIAPIFNAISLAVRILIAVIWTVLVTPFIIAFNAIAAVVVWAWNNMIKPAWDAIQAAAQWMWNNVLRPAFDAIARRWAEICLGMQIIWNTVLRPAWDALQAAAQWMWNNVLRPVFQFIGDAWNALMTGIRWVYDNILKPCWDALIDAANWLWNNVLKPVFDFIALGWRNLMDGIRWVYDNILRPCFDAVKTAVDSVGAAFQAAVNWIREQWNRIQRICADPINFVIDAVYNNGIRPAWNKIADWLGLGHLAPAAPIAFATGGRVPGQGNRDTVPAMLMPGEYVLSKKAIANMGGLGAVDNAHRKAREGAPQYAKNGGPIQHFAGGGAVHTWPHMWNIAQNLGVPVRKTSDYRPGDSGYHGKGQALDLAGNFTAIAQAIFDRFPHATQIISAQWRGGTGVLNGRPFYYAKDNPDHWDHVHWAMTPGALAGVPDPGGGSGGGFFDIAGLVVEWFKNTLMKPVTDTSNKILPDFGDNPYNKFPSGIAPKAIELGVDWVKERASQIWSHIAHFFGNLFGGGGGGGFASANPDVKAAVNETAAQFGWNAGPEWAAIVELLNRESSWNPAAANPTSSARGLFQKMTHIHGPVEPTPGGQALWGLNYIRGRYGTPSAAVAFHDRNNWYSKGGPVKPNLYDKGGILPPTPGGYGLYANHTGKSEAVLTNEQIQWLRGAANGNASGSVVGGDLVIQAPNGASPEQFMSTAWHEVKHYGRTRGRR